MTDFILEILSEETPALMQKAAAENFAKIAAEIFAKNNLTLRQDQIHSLVTPRRLSILITGLQDSQAIASTKKIGPKINADKKAVAGFLRSVGLQDESELEQVENNGALCFAFASKASELKTAEIIKNSLPQILQKMVNSWPKLMRWDIAENLEQPKWIRPVRNILALFGSEIIDVEFAGLKSNNLTYGHFLKSIQPIKISTASDYKKILAENFVLVDANLRKEKIVQQVKKITNDLDLETIDNAEKSVLFDEITGLCEFPTALLADIDPKFMNLPEEVLILTLKLNQKYLCLKNKEGELAAKFIFISNAVVDQNSSEKIIKDNEKLVRARLSDAQFFIEEDLKKPLISRLDDLKRVILHKKLGSVYEKVSRLDQLTKFLSIFVPHCDLTSVERATQLCKADLTTKTVAELPELQGKIAGFYAQKQNEDQKISAAIYEHYLPQGLNAELPKTPLGIALSIADKMDTIVGFFLADEKPTSSKDPFALRRAALGIIRIGFEYNIAFPIRILVIKSLSAYQLKLVKNLLKSEEEKFEKKKADLIEEIIKFFVERLKFYLKENEGLRADIVNVVIEAYLSNLEAHKSCDILYLAKKVIFLDSFLTDPSNRNIIELYKRSANILAIEEKKDGKRFVGKPLLLSLKNKYEKTLYSRIKQIRRDFRKLVTKGEFASAFKLLNILEVPLAQFFDNLVINEKDEHIRSNRLLILSKIRDLFDEVADLSNIEIS
ncbi:MAG: glycine--tRNA ligase subunit beta [Proteobacteria bacterium]|nr:glycine--tRNA ligase subunit beta [Pseudomonadota bacterium]